MQKLKISADLGLPLDVAGEAIAILATRGAGKSYTSAALIEELQKAEVQTVVIDPTGVYWGLRSSAKGGVGLPIILLGGPHGDVPLEATAGKLIADLIVDTGQSLILDLSDFDSDAAQARFMTDFAERLYRRKSRSRSTLHLVVDEADEFASQKPQKSEARMVGAMLKLVRRGRSRGIGLTLITQRSASINKNALDLVETLIVMRMLGPRDRDAVEGWIKHKSLEDRAGVLDSLPSLPTGTAWVWSPLRNVLKKVAMRRIETFDSYKTPKAGEARVEPKATAKVDLEILGEQIKATAERAKQEDPAALRVELAKLRKQIDDRMRVGKELAAAPAPSETLTKVREQRRALADEVRQLRKALEASMKFIVSVNTELEKAGEPIDQEKLQDALQTALRPLANRIEAEFDVQRQRLVRWQKDGEKLLKSLQATLANAEIPIDVTVREQPSFAAAASSAPAPRREPRAPADPDVNIGKVLPVQQRILNALAELAALGVARPERVQVAFLSGYKHLNSKGLVNALGALRTAGLIDYPGQGTVVLTDAGAAMAEAPHRPMTSHELQERVMRLLGGASERLMRPLIDVYPDALEREKLAAAAGYGHVNSKGFVNAIGRLRSLGFIDYPQPRYVVAQPVLFVGA